MNTLGKFASKNPILFSFFAFIPLLITTSYFYVQITELSHLKSKYENVHSLALASLNTRLKKKVFLDRYFDKDPYFFDTYLESLNFLNQENEELNILKKQKVFANIDSIKNRSKFILEQNKLLFKEEPPTLSKSIKETDLHQIRPVEVNKTDLITLLSNLEHVKIAHLTDQHEAPQFLIKHFHLEKKHDVFAVKFDLIKREFFKNRKNQ